MRRIADFLLLSKLALQFPTLSLNVQLIQEYVNKKAFIYFLFLLLPETKFWKENSESDSKGEIFLLHDEILSCKKCPLSCRLALRLPISF